jgi:hypothetical protein
MALAGKVRGGSREGLLLWLLGGRKCVMRAVVMVHPT